MSYPRDLENLVLAYAPEGAIDLPFEDQRHIVREMTGYLPSDPEATAAYLANPRIGVLARDPMILPYLQQRIQDEMGVFVTDPLVVEQYLNRIGDQSLEILLRDPTTWSQVHQQVGDEDFHGWLLLAGTREALLENLRLTEREVFDLSDDERRTYFLAALRHQAWAELLAFSEEAEYTFGDYDTPEHRQEVLSVTPEEVRLLLQFEFEHGADDFTVNFPMAYYLEGVLERFMDYMSLLDERSRTITMSNMAYWRDQEGQRIEINLAHPIIQAYLQTYPDSRESQAIHEGGIRALHAINYGPRPAEENYPNFGGFPPIE